MQPGRHVARLQIGEARLLDQRLERRDSPNHLAVGMAGEGSDDVPAALVGDREVGQEQCAPGAQHTLISPTAWSLTPSGRWCIIKLDRTASKEASGNARPSAVPA